MGEITTLKNKNWPKGTVEVNDRIFNDTVRAYPVVVVDCWAPWCGPCRMIGPVIDKLAQEHQGRVVFCKLNVDTEKRIAEKYGIMSIPTIMIFKNGKLVDQQIGAVPGSILGPIIKKYL
jgi:thioredoxin 1